MNDREQNISMIRWENILFTNYIMHADADAEVKRKMHSQLFLY